MSGPGLARLPRVGAATPTALAALRRAPCAVCGRVDEVAMGARGPVKRRRIVCEIGHFGFCRSCLAATVEEIQPSGYYDLHVRVVIEGPMTGHRWITSAIEMEEA